MSIYLTQNTIIELICLITAFFCLRNDKLTAWKGMIIYLTITCLTEFSAIYLRKKLHHNNQWPYNISIIFEAVFISIMFQNLFRKYFNSKALILGGLAILLLIYLYDVQDHHFYLLKNITSDTLNNTTNDCMSVLFSLYSLYYFYLLLNDDDYIDLKGSAEFWWVVGVFFYYFGSTMINLLRNKLPSPYYDFLPYILLVLIWIIYSTWSYSFICRKWVTHKSGN